MFHDPRQHPRPATHGVRARLAALVAVAVVGMAGCGEDGDGGGNGGEAGASTTLEATEFQFEPAELTVSPGQHEFEIVNRGEVEHALEIHAPGGEVETERVAPGDTAAVTADLTEPGTYELYCPVGDHRERGMEGNVTVKEGAGGEAPPEGSGGGDEGGDEGGGLGY